MSNTNLKINEKELVNLNYGKMPGSYLFSEIASRISKYQKENPDTNLIKLGIGDVTKPLCPSIVEAMKAAADEMGNESTFRGYGPERGYEFLRDAIVKNDYAKRNVEIASDEVFVSDGSKCDCANISELFSLDVKVAVCDPVYPVYVDSNAMAGRAGDFDINSGRWTDIVYMPCTIENSFMPQIPSDDIEAPGLIYLCFPNNPTGGAIGYEDLTKWVDYANKMEA